MTKLTKFFLLKNKDGVLIPLDVPSKQLKIIPYNAAIKLVEQHIDEIANKLLGQTEWFYVQIDRTTMSAETSGGRAIKLADVPSSPVARIDRSWYPVSVQLYAGNEAEVLASVFSAYEESRKPTETDPALTALKGLSLAEIRQKEKEWDTIYNEGGEGYNPYRLPGFGANIDPLD